MDSSTQAGIVLLVKFKTSLSPDEMERRYKKRLPEFRKLPGLLQKYYLHDSETDEWGGLYIWDSQESLNAYLASDLRKSIPDAYQIIGSPRIETATVFDTLRT